MRTAMFLAVFCCVNIQYGQQSTTISGHVQERGTNVPFHNATIAIQGTSQEFFTDENGDFIMESTLSGEHTVVIAALGFVTGRFIVFLEGIPIDLGKIFLEKDITQEKTDNLITLTDGDLLDDGEAISGASGLLQSTRDIFLNRAAFDFGQAFFKVRGYDSGNGNVLLNGMPMNKFFDGRPQWNNWGGLNDVVRNQEFTNGLLPNPFTFGGILGNTNIDMRPSGLRPGIRVSSSASNRTYRGRLMATYNSGLGENGLAYTFSASRRWAKEGYVEGTLYDAYSFFGSLEYRLNTKNSLALTGILARNRRGRSAAITEEVFDLVGNQYNPYWGEQKGNIRNSREREVFEPIFFFNYFLRTKKLEWTTGIGYQIGSNTRGRLGYYNAPNPDPTYYRYLPSYYINSSIGADFINASLAKEGFLRNPQMQWEQLYVANRANNGKAAYVQYSDVGNDNQITLSSSAQYRPNENIFAGGGVNIRTLNSENYAEIGDLLGATFLEDTDTFSGTLNNVNGNLAKTEGEIFNY